MTELMKALGDPHSALRTVHVAGSKGKGSTCAMLASALGACGLTVGLYTSPHLVDRRERICINGSPIWPQDYANAIRRAALAARSIERKCGEATVFELETAAALLYFAEQAVDLAIIETGLGGKGDATNIIRPEITALTAIQLEHTELLGRTLEDIARSEAGIFRPGVPVLSVPQVPAAMAALRDAAAKAGTTLRALGEELDFSYRFEASADLGPHVRVCLSSSRSSFEHLPVPLRGEHQALNCGLALAVIDELRARGIDAPEGAVAAGLAKTQAQGRLELLLQAPRLFVDGAHTPDSIAALVRSVGAHVRYDSMVVVFGCNADKDIAGMLAKLAMGADKIIFTRAELAPRAADPRELQRKFADVSAKMSQATPTLKEALNLAARAVQRGDLILVTGSFALVGEAKRLIAARAAADALRETKPVPTRSAAARARR
jgi:dihydrofolate synthase/folylpolyglutamate synthase